MNPRLLQLLINVAGAIVGLAVIGYVIFAWLHTEVEAPCSARYPAATRFSLQSHDGKPLTAIELQARAGLRDLGVIDNASVERVEGGPAPEALQVKLRKLPAGSDPDAASRNGIEFRWAPPGMTSASAACLAYGLWLPATFAFSDGGFLPGVFAGGATARPQVSPGWDQNGQPVLSAVLESGDIRRISGRAAPLATNRWLKVEQEVVLNAAGQADGHVRLWIDGALVLEDLKVSLRKDAATSLAGVLVAAGYRHLPAEPGALRFSPFEISWR